ncbi:MAG: hypothetical protein RIE24_08665 [Silicimonas sp.]
MSILLAIGGLCVAALFAAAGYRANNNSRLRVMRDKIVYKGRVQAIYDGLRKSGSTTVTLMVQQAVAAKSMPCKSRI